MTTRNKRKLAALNKENCEEHPRSNLAQNSRAPRSQEDYITQISEEIEGRVTKRLSKEFSRTKNRILGALARLDDFLMNPLLPGRSGTTLEPSRNALNTGQGTNEDDSQNDPHPEADLTQGHDRGISKFILQKKPLQILPAVFLLESFTSFCLFRYFVLWNDQSWRCWSHITPFPFAFKSSHFSSWDCCPVGTIGAWRREFRVLLSPRLQEIKIALIRLFLKILVLSGHFSSFFGLNVSTLTSHVLAI